MLLPAGHADAASDLGGFGGGNHGMGGLGTLSCMSIDDPMMTLMMNVGGGGSSIGIGGGGIMGQMPLGGDQYQHANASMLKVGG